MTGSEILVRTLKDLGIKHIFGYPGGAVLSIFDTLYKDSGIEFILTRHEQGAAHAADAYGRSTGTPGVCIATSGPGATNLVTGIMTAYMDSSPMIAITGQVPLAEKGLDNFQEVDIIGITMPITKHSFSVDRASEIPGVLREAYVIATSGRPGPVVVDIPADIQEEYADAVSPAHEPHSRGDYSSLPAVNRDDISRAVFLISGADKPLIIAGAGVIKSGASQLLRSFAIENNIPVATSLLGIGAFPTTHSLSLGMGGIHGSMRAKEAIEEADVVIALGIRIENRFTGGDKEFLKDARVIHVDIDESELGKNIEAHIPIHSDVKRFLEDVDSKKISSHSDRWVDEITAREKFIPSDNPLSPEYFLRELNNFIGENTIICTDVGQHQMWTAQYCDFFHDGQHITSGGAGTMGFSLPASIGLQSANRGKEIVCIVGDGGFQMTSQELICMKEYRLPIKIIILNNSCLGMVKQLQDHHKGGRHMAVYLNENPDFMALSAAYEIRGARADTPAEFRSIMDEYMGIDEPVIIECMVDRLDNVHTN